MTWILRNERVHRLDDLILRRTNLALLGQVSLPLLEELAQLWATERDLADHDRAEAVAATADQLRHRFGISMQGGTPACPSIVP
jgi:glycerol-3-phosphate dehydrogenase